MLSKLTIIFAVFATVIANPLPSDTTIIYSNGCSGGSVSCCNTAQSNYDGSLNYLYHAFGVNIASATSQIGINCSPIAAAGVAGGSQCTSTTFCCQGNSFNGAVVVGCNPVIINN